MRNTSRTELEKDKSKRILQLLRKIGDGLAMQYDERGVAKRVQQR